MIKFCDVHREEDGNALHFSNHPIVNVREIKSHTASKGLHKVYEIVLNILNFLTNTLDFAWIAEILADISEVEDS